MFSVTRLTVFCDTRLGDAHERRDQFRSFTSGLTSCNSELSRLDLHSFRLNVFQHVGIAVFCLTQVCYGGPREIIIVHWIGRVGD